MLRNLKHPATRFLFSGHNLTKSAAYSVTHVGPENYDIPAGHTNSDMRDTSCNIALNRRRDLTLREDLCFYTEKGKTTLGEVFRTGDPTSGPTNSIIFGVPDMGSVCSEKHTPSFKRHAKDLKDLGVDQIFCVAVCNPDKAFSWAKKMDLAEHQIGILVDKNGAFARLLGVDLELPETKGPYQQRYAGLLEDGILVKLKVDEDLAKVKDSSAEAMIRVIKEQQALE